MKNFIINIRPIMLKLKSDAALSKEEKEIILQYYLKSINYYNITKVKLYTNTGN